MIFAKTKLRLASLAVALAWLIGPLAAGAQSDDAEASGPASEAEAADVASGAEDAPVVLSAEDIQAAVEASRMNAIALYREFLSLPNDAHHADDIGALVSWMEGAFTERGFYVERVNTAGNPVLFGFLVAGWEYPGDTYEIDDRKNDVDRQGQTPHIVGLEEFHQFLYLRLLAGLSNWPSNSAMPNQAQLSL